MFIQIDLACQNLRLVDADGALLREYPVSTAQRGAGEQKGSLQTPRGRHVIRAKIGAGLPYGAALVGRRPTGEVCTTEHLAQQPERDWILSRILWLSGCQPGFNRLGDCDTMARYIYIHGTPDDEPIDRPASHGCIRMRNADVIDLFERVTVGTQVLIVPEDADNPATFPLLKIDWRKGKDALSSIRQTVFVEEQGVPAEIELDSADAGATHFLIWDWQGRPAACARLLPEGKVGRMAVLPAWRGQGLGERLLQAAMQEARQRGWFELRAAAQASVTGFYTQAGFEPVGDPFEAAGIAHQMMRVYLSRLSH
ncbi:MAG: GNAT family N-acetyltransferase [Formivibrio sp.]|nr:GNAT family N-acetyltransferase [Formivibrio sp.]